MLKPVIWISLLLIVISACEASDTYDYGFSTGSYGGTDWPIWVEKLVFNESWGVPVGNLSGGRKDTSDHLPSGRSAGMGWVPLPHTIRARWFSYRTQTFYEATLEIPEEKRAQIQQWFKQYPRKGYAHNVVTGISGEGTMQAWWLTVCVNFGCPEYESHSFELTPRIPATVAEGDPSQYREQTKGEIKDGTIPPEVLDLLPPETDSSALK
ncbi:DUF2931 family protein [Gynuella sunshinyii]|uniref:DUF2931 family protein n=1 Tax=Gynuella sunshinyii YC6258 TaxID=1445510 RepID=A0A0C5VPT2_9GAMM|nr:DUF2931 family protein [Gynuella sunshinyii]AJQ95448.1 hypothetical Protein YC6258_03412 [Gynuella sunshinyii YC6258]